MGMTVVVFLIQWGLLRIDTLRAGTGVLHWLVMVRMPMGMRMRMGVRFIDRGIRRSRIDNCGWECVALPHMKRGHKGE